MFSVKENWKIEGSPLVVEMNQFQCYVCNSCKWNIIDLIVIIVAVKVELNYFILFLKFRI